MKKTLAALAVLGAFAATSAYAADVTLYGIVDLGLKYSHTDADNGQGSKNSLEMASGNQSGSRFGLKGTEDLGNGLKVGFVLENGFSADDGTLGNNSRLFGREAQANLSGAFGTISFGRVGQLTSANGSYGIAGIYSPFGTSWAGSVEGSTYMVGYTRMDNTITYVTPNFSGFQVSAQYSFDVNTKEGHDEGKTTANRYYALGATYKNSGLNLSLVADMYNWSSDLAAEHDNDDGYTISFGGNYDFGFMKLYAGAQYFDNMYKTIGDVSKDTYATIGTDGQFKGYGITAGVDAPLMGGKAMFAVGYADTESCENSTEEMTRLGASIGYTYNLSKRTNLYGVASYYKDKTTDATNNETKPSKAIVWAGMRHSF